MQRKGSQSRDPNDEAQLAVSLTTLARRLDAHRSSVRRWLHEAGVRPITVSQSRNGGIRYRWAEVEAWLASREYVD